MKRLIEIDEKSIFDIKNTDLMGMLKDGQMDSHEFIRINSRILWANKESEDFWQRMYFRTLFEINAEVEKFKNELAAEKMFVGL